jgi:multiple sugar transport system substrate-binding protein
MRHPVSMVAALVAVTITAASCTGSTPGSDTSDPDGRGPITLVRGKDTTGKLRLVLEPWNRSHPGEQVTFLDLPEKADDQRSQLAQNAEARSHRFDVLALDVVWTPEFAARGWIARLDDRGIDVSGLLPTAVKTGMYQGGRYSVPWSTDAGFLYYRKDLVPTPPTTWDELIGDCAIARARDMGCYAGQYAQYEGLTVNVSEAVNSAGGEIVRNDGKDVVVDSAEARRGLQFLVDGFQQGYIPREAITYKEEDSRRAFQQGRLLFLRNWPYVYGTASQPGSDSVVQGKFGVAPIPGATGIGSSTLGGYNLAVSAFSRHQQTAVDFIKYLTGEPAQRQMLTQTLLPPTYAALYDDAALQRRLPYLVTLKQALLAGRSRPATPNYNEVTLAVQRTAYPALQGREPVDAALRDMAARLRRAAD